VLSFASFKAIVYSGGLDVGDPPLLLVVVDGVAVADREPR
jgi:hypothetical protein